MTESEIRAARASRIAGKISGAISGISAVRDAFLTSSKLKDTSGLEKEAQYHTGPVSVDSNDALMAQWEAIDPLDSVSYSQVRDDGNAIGGIASGILGGAGAGTAFGPIGSIIGGGLGLISGIAGAFKGSADARERQRQLNEQRAIANNEVNRSFLTAAQSVDRSNDTRLQQQFFADGGVTEFNAGGTHETNPNGGVQFGINGEGQPMLAEEGEIKVGNYMFSDRLEESKGKTFAKAARKLAKSLEQRPNDPIEKRRFEVETARLAERQEQVKALTQPSLPQGQIFAKGGAISPLLRYAPAALSGLNVLRDTFGATNKDDFSRADRIEREYVKTFKEAPIRTPEVVKDTYKPFDTDYIASKIIAQGNALRNAIINGSGGNGLGAVAGLLASGYNTQQALADAKIKADEFNDQRRRAAIGFNRQQEQQNLQFILQQEAANRQIAAQRLQGIERSEAMRAAEEATNAQARSTNLNNFAMNLSSIGETALNRRLVAAVHGYTFDDMGNIIRTPGYSPDYAVPQTTTQANAGMTNTSSAGSVSPTTIATPKRYPQIPDGLLKLINSYSTNPNDAVNSPTFAGLSLFGRPINLK